MRRFSLFVLFLGGCGGVTFSPGQGQWNPAIAPAWAHQGRFAITDNRSDELSFVTDLAAQPQLLGNMPVGDIPVELEGPHHLAASNDGKFIYYNLSNYVPGSGSGPHGSHGLGTVPGSLVKIDAATGEKIAEVLVDRSPGDVILNKAGTLAFVSHYDLLRVQQFLTVGGDPTSAYSAIAIVDTASMTQLSLTYVCPTAHGEDLSADENTLYITCAQSDELAVLDISNPASPKIGTKVSIGPSAGPLGTPAYSPYALTVAPLDGTVWVSDNNSGDVRVFDPKTMKMDPSKVIPTGGVSMFGVFSTDGKTYYVVHQGDDKLTAIDTASLATNTLPFPPQVCRNAHAIRLAPGGQSAIVICEGDHLGPGTAVNVTFVPFVVTGYVQVGVFPDGAVWLPPAP
jgi:DNA-binding beta-propeller fold protein YncE